MQLEGTLKTVTYRNAENGFSVLKFAVEGELRPVAVTGTFPELSVGTNLRMEGEWKMHPKFGRQFFCRRSEEIFPENKTGLVGYLSGGLFKGIGEATAKRLVDTFGLELIEILDGDGDALFQKKIRGFSGKKVTQLLHDWKLMRESRETMLFLYDHGITGSVALRLWRQFGERTVQAITENPYMLCEEVWGIGFVKADEIARKVGIPEWSEERLEAGICYAIFKATSSNGHTFLPQNELLSGAAKELRLELKSQDDAENLSYALERLIRARKLVAENGRVSIPGLLRAEKFVAEFVANRIAAKKSVPCEAEDLEKFLSDFEREQGFAYDLVQKQGIVQAFLSRIFIITGGPGTGKTTLLKGILALAERNETDVTLAAPTGRAARRMQEVTGHDARTLHRLLEINPETGRFLRDENFPIETDIMIVDEFSMVDTWLCAGLMKALPEKARLILIGDKDQLPSIGPGNVLRDLLSIGRVPGICLSHIFRQASGNDIAEKAAQINLGHRPSPIDGTHFHYLPFETPDEALEILSYLILHEIPQRMGKTLGDVQILVPVHRGALGTVELNRFLQNLLNDSGKEFLSQGTNWKSGDRVMQLRNDYEKNVFNGDTGRIIALVKNDKKLTVDFDGHLVGYEGDELTELSLAYACTIHKSQGSEYSAVVLVLDSSHSRMLQRNLLYTGITRAKGHVWILSGNGAFDEAVRNYWTRPRYTHLCEMVSENLGEDSHEKAEPVERIPQPDSHAAFLRFLDES